MGSHEFMFLCLLVGKLDSLFARDTTLYSLWEISFCYLALGVHDSLCECRKLEMKQFQFYWLGIVRFAREL